MFHVFWLLIIFPFCEVIFLIVLSLYLAFSRLQKNFVGFSFNIIFCTLDLIMNPCSFQSRISWSFSFLVLISTKLSSSSLLSRFAISSCKSFS